MKPARFDLKSLAMAGLRFHWRMHATVALGVAAGTAVLVGALLVGDSVRGSLRELALDRLGPVRHALVADRFFRAALADEVSQAGELAQTGSVALPALMLPVALETPQPRRTANGVQLLGATAACWEAWGLPASLAPGAGEIVLNEHVAASLNVNAGDSILALLPRRGEIPPDSALGRKRDAVERRRWRVKSVIPATGLGAFTLHPSQRMALNALVRLEDLQSGIDQRGRANLILIAGEPAIAANSADEDAALRAILRPTLADYGVSIQRTERGEFQVTSERMLLEPAIEKAVLEGLAEFGPRPAMIYLANWIRAGANGDAKIPYSTVAALDFSSSAPFGPMIASDGQTLAPLADDEIAINQWAFDDLRQQGAGLAPGDPITLEFFEPESTHGSAEERRETFRLGGVAALVDAAGAPTPANDRELTPELKGVTDQESIDSWDAPFPFDASRIRSSPPNDQDDRYWADYKATPKAFVSLATGRRLWQSRFGRTTSIRVPAVEGATVASLGERIHIEPVDVGFAFRPVRRETLAAASGTTPFDALFLGFSMFLIVSALMLVSLLFRLSVERRSREIGILAGVGWPVAQVRKLLWGEAALTAFGGSLVGAIVGVGYAWLMIVGLRTWWVAAVSTPFLELHITPLSLFLGCVGGMATSFAAAAWSLRGVLKSSPRMLLASANADEAPLVGGASKRAYWTAGIAIVLAAASMAAGAMLRDEAQAGAFFGAGACALAAMLAAMRIRWQTSASRALIASGRGPLFRLAARNATRRPGRSTLTIGLLASATFLIASIGAFRLDPPERLDDLDSGSGGFTLWAESDLPVYYDVASPADRLEHLNFTSEDEKLLAGAAPYAMRVLRGDDASCLNLYRPSRPRMLGVPAAFIERGGFSWGGLHDASEAERANPWRLLHRTPATTPDGQQAMPVIVDANTATYSLKWSLGGQYEVDDGRGGKVWLEVVGLLKNSIFQGDVLLADARFGEAFPEVNGYRLVLWASRAESVEQTAAAVETALAEYGCDVERTDERLRAFMAVQNTYLSTFQTLGGLGLLLGMGGLAVVQLRNVLERRGELALLRAIGFRPRRLAAMVWLENAWLLFAGLATGVIAAAAAVGPHIASGRAVLPWGELSATLGSVALAGLLAGMAALRATLRAPLLGALRGE